MGVREQVTDHMRTIVLLTVAEAMGVDPFTLRESDRRRCDLTIDALLDQLDPPASESDRSER